MEPTATPPAVAAICLNMLGCCGCMEDIMGAEGGAAAGTWLGGGGAARGAGAAMRGAGAREGGEAERPRRGILFGYEEICKTTKAH